MTALAVCVSGMVLIGVLGFLGRTGRYTDLAEWTVAGRNFGAFTVWFLQAGETFTTFTFLAVAGLAFTGGAAATYAIPYLPLAFVALYFVAPVVWRLGKRHGYLTQADFFSERYASPLFGKIVAVLGVVFLLPYLQLQITGLGLIVRLVTGNASSGVFSMVLATGLVVAFVLWSGIRGVANTAYLKDALMVIVLVVLLIVVPLHYAGGIEHVFATTRTVDPAMLTVHAGKFSELWWLSSVLVSAVANACMTVPHQWPGVLSARNERALRLNAVFLPVYQIAIMIPIIIGFTGLLVLSKTVDSNGVLLTLTAGALPGWAVGVVAVAAVASAMVPSAAMCIGMSTLVARNLVRPRRQRGAVLVNHTVVVVTAGLALVLGILRPDLLANLLLLTFSGLVQFAPGLVAALGDRRLLSKGPAILGLLAGEVVVVWLTFNDVSFWQVNPGIIGLACNIVLAVGAQVFTRTIRPRCRRVGAAPT
jgi:solute:Na+ symporter, SSS family